MYQKQAMKKPAASHGPGIGFGQSQDKANLY
jgi:hypothetical protein